MAETTTIIQIIGGAGVFLTAVGALITSFRTNRKVKKTKAEEDKLRAEEEDIRAGAAQKIVNAAAEQLKIIESAATRARIELEEERVESDKWKNHCEMLEVKVKTLAIRVDKSDVCQSNLTAKLAEQQSKLDTLEAEKMALKKRIVELESKLKDYESKFQMQEDTIRKLKEDQRNSEAVVS